MYREIIRHQREMRKSGECESCEQCIIDALRAAVVDVKTLLREAEKDPTARRVQAFAALLNALKELRGGKGEMNGAIERLSMYFYRYAKFCATYNDKIQVVAQHEGEMVNFSKGGNA